MKRREAIALIGGAAAWPLAARAQSSSTMPLIGFLSGGSSTKWAHYVAAFRGGLKELGFVENQNLKIQYRWADDQFDRLPKLAADLVNGKVAVIAATGGNAPALAAKAATTTIPIVFTGGGDPVKLGLVASLNHPGGNATGVTNFATLLDAKRLQTLHQLVPQTEFIAVLINPSNPSADTQLRNVQDASHQLGLKLEILRVTSQTDLESAFAELAKRRVGAVIVCADVLFMIERKVLIALQTRYGVPMITPFREIAENGGLVSYGSNIEEVYRLAGLYTARILKGEKPSDLPVQQPTKFDLIINLRTAKALGVTVPQALVVAADKVIE